MTLPPPPENRRTDVPPFPFFFFQFVRRGGFFAHGGQLQGSAFPPFFLFPFFPHWTGKSDVGNPCLPLPVKRDEILQTPPPFFPFPKGRLTALAFGLTSKPPLGPAQTLFSPPGQLALIADPAFNSSFRSQGLFSSAQGPLPFFFFAHQRNETKLRSKPCSHPQPSSNLSFFLLFPRKQSDFPEAVTLMGRFFFLFFFSPRPTEPLSAANA